MDLQLNGKVILITGGAKGIGAAIARACAKESAIPVIIDRDSQAAATLQSEIEATGSKAHSMAIDLTAPENCRDAVEQAGQTFGRIDALVNNAGINDAVSLEQGSPEKYLASLQRNLIHVYNITHYALPGLKVSTGSIVNIASKTAVTGQGNTSGYASAKGAILALTREWAAELLPYNIRVNAVVPAEVMTGMYRRWLDSFPSPDEKLKSIVAHIPLGKRMTEPEEIADSVLFLLSARASHITGQHIFVDGGYVHLDRALL